MKKILLFLVTILTINCYSQISFEKGYYIDNSDKKTDCLIKNKDWEFAPTDFQYKIAENDAEKTIGLESVKEFGIYNNSKYIRKTVKIDKSDENISNLNEERNPTFNEEQLFLKVLIEGKANLYEGGKPRKFFYNVEGSNIEQLIFKSYIKPDGKIVSNDQFKQQLFNNLKCSTIKMNDLEKLNYKKNNLINLFGQYNKCSNSDFTNYEEKVKRDIFNLSLRPRLNNSSLSIQNPESGLNNTEFDKKLGFGFGIEAELIFPFNKNKWAFLVEPTYQSYNEEKVSEIRFQASSNTEVKYNSIEIPLGIRHYFFLNNNSKIFINASYVFDIPFNSTIEFTNTDISFYRSLKIDMNRNYALGIGYKLYDKYSIEMRYHTRRNILPNYTYWGSDYKTISIIFGYSIF